MKNESDKKEERVDNSRTSFNEKGERVISFDKRIHRIHLPQLPQEWEDRRFRAAVEFFKEEDIETNTPDLFVSNRTARAIAKAEFLTHIYLLMRDGDKGSDGRDESRQSGDASNNVAEP